MGNRKRKIRSCVRAWEVGDGKQVGPGRFQAGHAPAPLLD